MKPHKELIGRMVRLREVSFADIVDIVAWRNDPDIRRYINAPVKLTDGLQRDYLKKYFQKSNEYYFLAETLEEKKKIGTVSIYNIDRVKNRGEFGRLIIPQNHRLFAFEASFLALRFAFDVLGLDKVFGYAIEENKLAVSFDLKLGLRKVRTLARFWHNQRDGKKYDAILFEMDKGRFLQTKKMYHDIIEKARWLRRTRW